MQKSSKLFQFEQRGSRYVTKSFGGSSFAFAAALLTLGAVAQGIRADDELPSAAIKPVRAAEPAQAEAPPALAATVKRSFLVNSAGMMVPVPVEAPPHPQRQVPLISVEFNDVPITDLISMIAKQGDVGIIISGDVEGKIPYIRLVDKTPEEAIRLVAQSAALVWRKVDDKTYAVAKQVTELPPVDVATVNPVPMGGLPMPRNMEGADATEGTTTALPPLSRLRSADTSAASYGETDAEDQPDYAYIKLRNVTPRMMAWWLDSAHNPEPIEFSQGRKRYENANPEYVAKPAVDPRITTATMGGAYTPENNVYNPFAPAGSTGRNDYGNNGGQNGYSDVYTQRNPQFGNFGNNGNNGNGNQFNNGGNQFNNGGNNGNNRNGAANNGVFALPKGVISLVAVDPQNALLVRATPDGVDALTKIISYLDKPLRQVEIEAQFVTVSTSDVKLFGIDFASSNGPFNTSLSTGLSSPGTFSLGYVRNNFKATLQALESKNRAKNVSAPRVTAINNIPASLYSTVGTPITVTSTQTGISGATGQSQNVYYVQTSVGLTVTATINNDDTVTVVMSPQVQSQGAPVGSTGAPVISSQTVQTIANVRDGDTIALGGLRTKDVTRGGNKIPILGDIPLIGGLFRTKNDRNSESELIIFLTARILRRVDQPVPGV